MTFPATELPLSQGLFRLRLAVLHLVEFLRGCLAEHRVIGSADGSIAFEAKDRFAIRPKFHAVRAGLGHPAVNEFNRRPLPWYPFPYWLHVLLSTRIFTGQAAVADLRLFHEQRARGLSIAETTELFSRGPLTEQSGRSIFHYAYYAVPHRGVFMKYQKRTVKAIGLSLDNDIVDHVRALSERTEVPVARIVCKHLRAAFKLPPRPAAPNGEPKPAA